MKDLRKVKVKTWRNDYDISIGSGILSAIGENLRNLVSGGQVIIVTNQLVYDLYGREVKESLLKAEFEVIVYFLPDGEEYKTWENCGQILTAMLTARLNRDAIMIALGGGVVGDIAGFAASIYQRGINYVQIPTTLLAQVDSSVGGKVAVNHPLGKNMVGSFHQPIAVWTELKTLKTLPEREWTAGLAEVIKYGLIWDETFFDFLEKNTDRLKQRDEKLSKEIIVRSCEIKGAIVGQDEREEGIRAILNFGHTIGHALEKATDYKLLRHGEGVAIGMVAAGNLAVSLNKCSHEVVQRIERILKDLGLPVAISAISPQEVLESIYLDKKVKDKQLVFVLPKEIGKVEIIKGIQQEQILKSLETVIKN